MINIGTDPEGRKNGALNILLTEAPASKARSIKGWDIIVTSSGEELEEPIRAGRTIIVSGSSRGKRLGILTLKLDDKGAIRQAGHAWQSLGKEVEEDARVRGVLKEYDEKVAELIKDEERKTVSESPYLGAGSCASCHQPFAEHWLGTRHSRALSSLERVGKSKDPECVICHTTGYGEEGGFYSSSATPGLSNVQCEACHGPGRDHAADYSTRTRPVGEGVCVRCHTKENSPDFDFGVYLDKIRHR